MIVFYLGESVALQLPRHRFNKNLGFREPLIGAHSGLWVGLGPRGLRLKPMRVRPKRGLWRSLSRTRL
jgi:hypothetical protein